MREREWAHDTGVLQGPCWKCWGCLRQWGLHKTVSLLGHLAAFILSSPSEQCVLGVGDPSEQCVLGVGDPSVDSRMSVIKCSRSARDEISVIKCGRCRVGRV